MVYLDNAATTKPCQAAVMATFYCMVENYGNPSALHRLGIEAEKVLDNTRKSIGSALSADPYCIYFTSGATESNNLAIFSSAELYGKRRRKIVTTTIEHPSVAQPINLLQERGFEVVRIAPNRNGVIDYNDIFEAVDDKTCLVSTMLVNNETGYVLPIKRAFMNIKRSFPECITHTDAVQGFLKMPIRVNELYADLLSISAHKVHGVKGIGALYVKKGIRMSGIIKGGGQEKNIRSGTESVPLIAGFGAAVKTLNANLNEYIKNAEELSTYLKQQLVKLPNVELNSLAENCSPFIVNASFLGTKSEILLHTLEEKNIFISSGSACSKYAEAGGGKPKTQQVLKEFGLDDKHMDSAIRISISIETTRGNIDDFIDALSSGETVIPRL